MDSRAGKGGEKKEEKAINLQKRNTAKDDAEHPVAFCPRTRQLALKRRTSSKASLWYVGNLPHQFRICRAVLTR